jgi:hypothetical protein
MTIICQSHQPDSGMKISAAAWSEAYRMASALEWEYSH